MTSIEEYAFNGWYLPVVISLIENPFAIIGKTSGYSTFSQKTFNNATLYVPIGTIDKYKATDGWKDFAHIKESDMSGINTVETDNSEISRYSLNGNKLPSSTKGINIIKMKDGTTKKVLVK